VKRFPLASAITAILWVGFAGSVHAQEQESAPEVAELGHFEVLPGNLERYPGLVVCAPHADHDRNTGMSRPSWRGASGDEATMCGSM
jgi:hypothetical protein